MRYVKTRPVLEDGSVPEGISTVPIVDPELVLKMFENDKTYQIKFFNSKEGEDLMPEFTNW